VRSVRKASGADGGDAPSPSNISFARGPEKDVFELHMFSGRPPISLSATAGEGVLNDQLRNARVEAARPTILMPDASGQFVDQFGGKDLSQAEKEMVFAPSGIAGPFRQIKPPTPALA